MTGCPDKAIMCLATFITIQQVKTDLMQARPCKKSTTAKYNPPEAQNLLLFDVDGKHLRSCRDGQLANHTFPGQA